MISETGDKAGLARLFFKIGKEFGFDYTTLMIMPAKTDLKISGLILETQLPPEFFLRHDELVEINKCPIFDQVRASIIPRSFTLQNTIEWGLRIGGTVHAIVGLLREFEMNASLYLPLSSIDGSRHIIRFDGNRHEPDRWEINELCMMAMMIFDAYDRVRYPLNDNPCGLTEREVEVMRWTATGKTSSEIGQIMQLSDHTINAYMNNAFRKLDCVNRTQLVAKALRMRVIS
jgi:DNA-binding CsgD family transcriptional regulator